MRINKGHVDTIVSRAIKSSFEKREAALVKEEAALGIKAYNSMFPADLRKKLAALPEKWLRHCDCLQFTVRGQYHRLCVGKKMATPADNYCSQLGELPAEVGEEVVAFDQRKDDLKREKNVAEIKLRGMLSNISTFAKLSELWPEGKAFYSDLDEDAKIKGGLPAIKFDDVNAMLGIKKAA
jgi:hypothetical protein